MAAARHSYGWDCPRCGDGRSGTWCDHSNYGRRFVRFVRVPLHAEAYQEAYLAPSGGAARNELERLHREWQTLPPRHECTCWPQHCGECRRIDAQRPKGPDVAVEIGRSTGMKAPPMPLVLMLDLERALATLGQDAEADAIARQLNGRQLEPLEVDAPPEPAPLSPREHPEVGHVEVTVGCACLGFRLGGPSYCAHQPPGAVRAVAA